MASMMDDLDALVVTASGERKASDFVRKLSKFEILTSLFLQRREGKMFLHCTQVAGIDVGTLNELTLPTPSLPPQTSHDQQHGEESISKMICQRRQHCFSLAKKIEIDEIEDEESIGVISNVVPLVDRPQEITFCSSQVSFQPDKIERLTRGLNITGCLQRLRLHRMSLNDQSLTVVTSAIHQASNLQELFLSENPLGSSVSCLAENLQHVPQLETLELNDVLMEEEAFSDLANSLCDVPELKVLCVSRNKLGSSITVLANTLNSIRGLTHLELSQTQMDEEGAMALSNGLRSLTKLEVLDISHNPLGRAVTEIAHHLQNTPCLTELHMTNTEMGCDEATAVAASFKYLQNLRMLSVGSNPLGGGVHSLVQHLSKIPKLKHLNLTSVLMRDEEVNLVSKACKRARSVTITTDYLDAKGERLPAKVKNSSFARSFKSNDEWEDDYDYYEDRDSYENSGDNEEDDQGDDYDEYRDDYPFPDDYNDYNDDNDREEDDIVSDREDDYDEDRDDYPFPDDYNDDNDREEDDIVSDREDDYDQDWDVNPFPDDYNDDNDREEDDIVSDREGDYDEDRDDYPFPDDYNDYNDDNDREEDDIASDREDNYDEDRDSSPSPGDFDYDY